MKTEDTSQALRLGRRGYLRLGLSFGLWGCASGPHPEQWSTGVVSGVSRLGEGPRWIHSDGSGDWSRALEHRGHGVAVDPRGTHVVLVARRPGRILWIRDIERGEVTRVQAAQNRHYLGHGVFDASGRYLYVTENVFGSFDPTLTIEELMRESVLGVYDRDSGYARIKEIPAHGIGSHELRWMPDGRTLVVANGGIYTHPEQEREMLNPDALAPSLVYVDAASGELVEKVAPEDPQLSMRHLAVHPSGGVTVGLQYQGAMQAEVPLVVSHRRGTALREWKIPQGVLGRMKQYTASVETHPNFSTTAVSAPKAGAVLLFDAQGRFVRAHELPDSAGLGVTREGYVASSGTGWLQLLGGEDLALLAARKFESIAWDNHLGVIS